MKEEYMEREKRYMIETMMKKKNVDQKQMEEYFKRIEANKCDEDGITKIQLEADETYNDVINKLLATEHNDEYVSTHFCVCT